MEASGSSSSSLTDSIDIIKDQNDTSSVPTICPGTIPRLYVDRSNNEGVPTVRSIASCNREGLHNDCFGLRSLRVNEHDHLFTQCNNVTTTLEKSNSNGFSNTPLSPLPVKGILKSSSQSSYSSVSTDDGKQGKQSPDFFHPLASVGSKMSKKKVQFQESVIRRFTFPIGRYWNSEDVFNDDRINSANLGQCFSDLVHCSTAPASQRKTLSDSGPVFFNETMENFQLCAKEFPNYAGDGGDSDKNEKHSAFKDVFGKPNDRVKDSPDFYATIPIKRSNGNTYRFDTLDGGSLPLCLSSINTFGSCTDLRSTSGESNDGYSKNGNIFSQRPNVVIHDSCNNQMYKTAPKGIKNYKHFFRWPFSRKFYKGGNHTPCKASPDICKSTPDMNKNTPDICKDTPDICKDTMYTPNDTLNRIMCRNIPDMCNGTLNNMCNGKAYRCQGTPYVCNCTRCMCKDTHDDADRDVDTFSDIDDVLLSRYCTLTRPYKSWPKRQQPPTMTQEEKKQRILEWLHEVNGPGNPLRRSLLIPRPSLRRKVVKGK